MKDIVRIRDYIEELLKTKHLTLAQLAELLGYKSTTSLKRLMNESVQDNGCRKFETLMLNSFDLSDTEKNTLKAAVEETIRGKEKRRNVNEILRFLSVSRGNIESADDHITILGEEKQQLIDRYHQKTDLFIRLVNCPDLVLFSDLLTLTKMQAVKIRHYLFFDDDPANIVRLINALMSIFSYSGYDAWYVPHRPNQTEPYMTGNFILVSYMDEKGKKKQEILLMNDQHEALLLGIDDGYTFTTDHLFHDISPIQLKRTFFSDISMENYVQYSAAYAELERDRSIWKIKPDIGIDYIPYDILFSALNDGSAGSSADFSQIIDQLISIYKKRVDNTYEKHKVIHTVMKKSAMLEFAKTGLQTDHFWCMRPYTKAERKRILELLLEQQKNNVYFNLHFLKDDSLLRDTEIACYEGKGFLILKSDTSYLLTDSHSEIMLSCKPLEKEFVDFFRHELIQKYCLTYQESIAFINRLIRICS